jgi:3-oxoacyl-(acyl-carrier-protein) synthase/pimeloyl-ACP methyl ester carboxylesterase
MRRVVVTGIGIVAPSGVGQRSFWSNNTAGRTYLCHEPLMAEIGMRSHVVSRLERFDVGEHHTRDHAAELSTLSRFVQFGATAGIQAARDSGLSAAGIDRARAGVIFSSAIGGTPEFQDAYERLSDRARHPVRAFPDGSRFYDAVFLNFTPAFLARHLDLRGPCTSLTTGCTAGIDALGLGFELIRQGDLDVVLCGAAEAPLSGLAYATLDIIGSLAVVDCPPGKASRPFDARRGGFVLGEGAAALVLEEHDHARRRGANAHGEVLGFASVNNAYHMTDLASDGSAMAEALRRALSDAAVAPEEIDYVNAHGSSTPQNDIFETRALKTVLGARAYHVPVSSTKSMIGHSLSAASLTAAIATLGAMRSSVVPPTANYEVPDPECDLDYVPNQPRRHDVATAVVMASGFGGIHSCCVLRRLGRPNPRLRLVRTAVNGCRTLYIGAGPHPAEADQAVLLLHGLGGSARHWEPVMSRLPGDAALVAVDLPGHGENELPATCDAADVIEFLLAFLDSLGGPSRVGVVGQSLGGLIAMRLALAAPQRVGWLGLLATGATVRLHHEVRRQLLARDLDDRFLTACLVRPLASNTVRMVTDDFRRVRLGGQGTDVWGVHGLDLNGELSRLAVPVQVIVAGADVVVSPRKGRALAAAIPDAELVVLCGAGHYLHLECPDEVADHLARLIAVGAPHIAKEVQQ